MKVTHYVSGKLYQLERSIKDKTPDERKVVRLEKAKPILAKIKVWLDGKANRVLPKAYLNHLFEHLPVAKMKQALVKLLPQNLHKSDLTG